MSRVGKKPIPIPKGVTVTIQGGHVVVKGPKGQLEHRFPSDITINQEGDEVIVIRPTDMRHHRALHGMTRALINNMVVGVSDGFTRTLIINGVGYRAEVDNETLILNVGYSHPVRVEPTDTLSFDVPKESRGQQIIISGIDKQEVGEVAAYIRKQRPPEPYLGKGIRYSDETIRRKEGKSGKA